MANLFVNVSCACSQRLRAIAFESSPSEVRFYWRRAPDAAWERVARCPNCQRDFSGVNAEALKDLLGEAQTWS
jgi:hypothetical protein